MKILRHLTPRSESGQAVIEYVLLLAIIIFLYTLVLERLAGSNGFEVMKKPLTQDFKYTYRYGHPEARGQTDGGPKLIPQHHEPAQNFRIFINPPINE
jgi:hypothetical protein